MEIDLGIDSFGSYASSPNKLKHNEDDVALVSGNTNVLEGSSSGSLKSDHANNYDFGMMDGGDDGLDEEADFSDYDDEADDPYYDYLKKMEAQFDSVDMPPGVEVPVSWMNDLYPGTSSSVISAESSLAGKEVVKTEAEVLRRFQAFKRFDTVANFPDHHFSGEGAPGKQQTKSWMIKVQQEWGMLRKGLPDTIFVRASETRMDLLRAVIIGPAGTPYHDGLFVFDVQFPPTYPDVPPMVYYYSGGLRINPNLYICGKVCLSLLNTWRGDEKERWMPETSTMLQVLVSIQALILNEKPFFNEPGHETAYHGAKGQRRSKEYNENVFIYSLKTMMYTLWRPPKYFEDFVSDHFRLRSFYILSACKAYLEGAEIGSEITDDPKEAAKRNNDNHLGEFKGSVSKLMNNLITAFTNNGSQDYEPLHINVPGCNVLL